MRAVGGAALMLLLAAGAGAATGPPAARVEGVGDPAQAKELARLMPVKRGGGVDAAQAPLAREIALSYLQNHGYLEAQAEASVEGGALVLRARPGPLYRFGRTRFEGLAKLSDRALRHELTYDEGAPYERPELLRTQGRLFGLGLFEDVDIGASTTTARTADVVVRVKERPLKWLKTGIGYGSEERERLSLSLTHYNLLRRAYVGEVSVLYSHIWLETRGDFTNRHFWGTDAEQRTTVSWRRENRQGYDLERSAGAFGLTTMMPHHLRLTTQYKVSRTVLYNVDPDIAASEPEKPLQSGVSLGLEYDTTDDLFFPSRGVRLGTVVERQGGFLAGDVDLNRGSARATAYWTPFRRLVGAATFSGGVVRQFPPSDSVPIFERWFMGGATSVRGYRERDIGPKDALGNPLGGNVFTRGGLEARFPLYKRIGGAVFLDGGMVNARENLVWPALWKWGAGPGLRVRTPVGPVRLDLGWKINPEPDVARWVVHFSLGEAF